MMQPIKVQVDSLDNIGDLLKPSVSARVEVLGDFAFTFDFDCSELGPNVSAMTNISTLVEAYLKRRLGSPTTEQQGDHKYISVNVYSPKRSNYKWSEIGYLYYDFIVSTNQFGQKIWVTNNITSNVSSIEL